MKVGLYRRWWKRNLSFTRRWSPELIFPKATNPMILVWRPHPFVESIPKETLLAIATRDLHVFIVLEKSYNEYCSNLQIAEWLFNWAVYVSLSSLRGFHGLPLNFPCCGISFHMSARKWNPLVLSQHLIPSIHVGELTLVSRSRTCDAMVWPNVNLLPNVSCWISDLTWFACHLLSIESCLRRA
jgi:hypothetical protein